MFRDLKSTNHIDFNDAKTRDIYIFIYYISKLNNYNEQQVQ